MSTALFSELRRLNNITWQNFRQGIPWQADVAIFEKELQKLRQFDLSSLKTDSDKKVFWINLYHILIRYLIAKLNIRKSLMSQPWLFWWYRVRVGKYGFSLNDIENGILRANGGHPALFISPFWLGDERKEFMCSQRDPRIHFVLSYGVKSSPIMHDLAESKLDTYLDLSEYEFSKKHFKVDKLHKRLTAHKLFDWYSADFEGTYLDAKEYQDYEVEFEPFDWSVVI